MSDLMLEDVPTLDLSLNYVFSGKMPVRTPSTPPERLQPVSCSQLGITAMQLRYHNQHCTLLREGAVKADWFALWRLWLQTETLRGQTYNPQQHLSCLSGLFYSDSCGMRGMSNCSYHIFPYFHIFDCMFFWVHLVCNGYVFSGKLPVRVLKLTLGLPPFWSCLWCY